MPKSLFPKASIADRAKLEQDPTIKLFNTYDWSQNPLGPIPDWPEDLKGAVRLMVTASTPMSMMVGPKGILIYNNGYAEFAGIRHPEIFGRPTLEAWPEIADFNRSNIERGLRNESWTLARKELTLNRHGELEPAWMDLHYSPIVGSDGVSMGTLCVLHDTTDRMLSEQALVRSEERMAMALSSSALVGTWDWNLTDDVVTADDQFASMFGIDPLRSGLGVSIEQYLAAIHPDDIAQVREEIAEAIRTAGEYRSEFRLPLPDGSVRWVVTSGRPRISTDGKLWRFPGVAIDVTEHHRAAEALAESEVRFRTLANVMPQMVFSALPSGYTDYHNARWFEFVGSQTEENRPDNWLMHVHPEDQDRALADWKRCMETGETYEVEYRLRHKDGYYRWFLARALPIVDANGHVTRWIGTVTDIDESRRVTQERELVAQELSHRIKNIFAVLNGIVGLSARSHPDSKLFADQLRQRIYALGEAHDFVRPHSDRSTPSDGQGSLAALVDRLMRPYNRADGSARVRLEGDDAPIDDAAATPLALLFHELATNAAKYGALSTEAGQVELKGERLGENYQLTWRESGGPIPMQEDASGFGSRLINLSVEGQMRGKIARHWDENGLTVVIDVPLEALQRSARLRSKPE